MRIGIIGSRTYENKRNIREMVYTLKQQFGDKLTIVSGGCKDGADKYAKKYFFAYLSAPSLHPPDTMVNLSPNCCFSV